jgi:hypothetical protein
MSHFRDWYQENDVEITWALIGALVAFGIADLEHGNYGWAMINWAFAYINYIFRKI